MKQEETKQLVFAYEMTFSTMLENKSKIMEKIRDTKTAVCCFPFPVWNPLLNGWGWFTEVDNRCSGVRFPMWSCHPRVSLSEVWLLCFVRQNTAHTPHCIETYPKTPTFPSSSPSVTTPDLKLWSLQVLLTLEIICLGELRNTEAKSN